MGQKACSKNRAIKLHLGCGAHVVQAWINMDGSWNAWLAKYPMIKRVLRLLRMRPKSQQDIPWSRHIVRHNLTKPLPFATSSVRYIYSSHLLEHLYFEEAKNLLAECYRVLETSGVLRMVLPDLKSCILEYFGQSPFGRPAEESQAMCSAERLNRRLLLRSPSRPEGSILYRIYSAWTDFHSHKWMYDAEALKKCFLEAGFANVEEKGLYDSRIDGIQEIERAERIENGAGICVEGTKD